MLFLAGIFVGMILGFLAAGCLLLRPKDVKFTLKITPLLQKKESKASHKLSSLHPINKLGHIHQGHSLISFHFQARISPMQVHPVRIITPSPTALTRPAT